MLGLFDFWDGCLEAFLGNEKKTGDICVHSPWS
jgi:hypothetical protein